MHTKRQRAVACIVCAAYLLVTLCSVLFIAKEADHDCAGADCSVCARIAEAANELEKLGSGAPSADSTVVLAAACILAVFAVFTVAAPSATPVALKVRMNN